MSQGRLRERSLDNNDQIPTLFQGPHPDKKGEYYPGDRQLRDRQGVTVQIHYLTILKDKKVLVDDVPTIAIALPPEMSTDWIIQTNKKASKNFARPNWE
jgi:hypothetical protein